MQNITAVGTEVNAPDGHVVNPTLSANLSFLRPGDQAHIVVIHPDRDEINGRDFGTDYANALAWINEQNALGFNCYWSVNEIAPGVNKKPSKADVTAVRFAHVDVDDINVKVDEIQADWSPSILIHSGGGLQAFWRLTADSGIEAAEQINRGAVASLGGDVGTHNADRLMRVPGTINWPNAAKRQRGRVPVMACLLHADDSTMPSTLLAAMFPTPAAPVTASNPEQPVADMPDGVELTAEHRARVDKLLSDAHRQYLHDGIPEDEDWSAEIMGPVNKLRHHFEPGEVLAIVSQSKLAHRPKRGKEMSREWLWKHVVGKAFADKPSDDPYAVLGGQPFTLPPGVSDVPDGPMTGQVLPPIRVIAGQLDRVADEAEMALLICNESIFVFDNALMRPIQAEVDCGRGRTTHVTQLHPVSASWLVDRLSKLVRFEKWLKSESRWVPTDPPMNAVSILMARVGSWRFNRITGIATCPTLRPDGTMLIDEGFDPATGLLLARPPVMPAVPDHPTRADALRALQTIDELFDGFPFVDQASRSVALSAVITVVVRGGIDAAPMHAITAPAAGTGKSFLVDIVSVIASGRLAPVMSASSTREGELDKQLGAALMVGRSFIALDNINGPLSSDLLCQAIERPAVDVRVLGESRNVTVPNKTCIFATGNNIEIRGDLVRRTLLCSLDAGVERPEKRTFPSNPCEIVATDRGRYVAAALMIVRAYVTAGCPGAVTDLASFEQWSRLVRSAMIWLGRADPLRTMETSRAGDTELGCLRTLMATWRAVHGDTFVRARDAVMPRMSPHWEELRQALSDVAATLDRRDIDHRRLGNYLSQHKGRIVDGMKIEKRDGDNSNVALWSIVST